MCCVAFAGRRKGLGWLSSSATAGWPGMLSPPPLPSGQNAVAVAPEPASASHWTWSASPTRASFAVQVPPDTGLLYEQSVLLLSATSVQLIGAEPSQRIGPSPSFCVGLAVIVSALSAPVAE